MATRVAFVSSFLRVTAEPGTTAPVVSVTVPVMSPVVIVCPKVNGAQKNNATAVNKCNLNSREIVKLTPRFRTGQLVRQTARSVDPLTRLSGRISSNQTDVNRFSYRRLRKIYL